MNNLIMVTGGAGFIGSAVIRHLVENTGKHVVNLDKLTYAGNLATVANVAESARYTFQQVDVCDSAELKKQFNQHQPRWVMHLAAESHVDRSIDGPADFVQTNIVGTYCMLQTACEYWQGLGTDKDSFKFHHISTDEVYGSLGAEGLFTEQTPYSPNSPYSASKASSDHLVRAWNETYGLPTVVSNCSNNYGPYQFPEKLIPVVISKAIGGEPIPVYGKGDNVRDWLYVEDHARALHEIVANGEPGQTYNVGGDSERTNLEVVKSICLALDELKPKPGGGKYADQITFVTDRPGHDFRYAIDASKIRRELGWKPQETFESGLRKTVEWYLQNDDWFAQVTTNKYQGQRLGLQSNMAKPVSELQSGTAA